MGHDERDDGAGRASRLVQAVRRSPLFGGLRNEALATVLGHGRVVHLAPHGHVRHADSDAVAVVLDGVAIATVLSDHGAEVILRFPGPGAVCGLPVVLGQPGAGASVTALTSVDALVLPGPELRRSLSEVPGLHLACLRVLAADLAADREEIARFAYTSTTDRVIARLVELGDRWGAPEEHGIRVTLPLTQQMLASWARASRESTAKVLHDLRQARVIRTARRELVIFDVERLRARGPGGRPHDDMLRSLLREVD